MKRVILLLILALSSTAMNAQTKLSIEFSEIIQLKKKGIYHFSHYASSSKDGIHYIHTIALIDTHFDSKQLASKGIMVGSIIQPIATLRIPLSLINENFNIKGIKYLSPSHKIASPMLNKAVKDSRVDSVHQGLTLPRPFSGKDVLIGITDWGFDYTNPMFYDTTLAHTRILRAWDQFRTAGPAPVGFSYGTELSGEQALLQAQCDTFNFYGWATHGSHVAGICGGSGAGTVYRGVAYDAQYLMTTIMIDESAIIDAYSWMHSVAQEEQKRLVINMSWGLYWLGNLDGTSLISQAIDALSAQGVVFVASAGNNGDETFHIKKQFSSATDTLKTVIGFNNYSYYPTMWGQSVSAWGEPNHSFEFGIKLFNSSNEELATSNWFSSNQTGYIDTLMIVGVDTIFYNIQCDSANVLNQRPHARIRVQCKNSLYKVALQSTSNSGTVHFWNLIELINDAGNWGGTFLNPLPDYTAGDAQYSIGEPACTKSVISIAAHSTEIILPNGNVYLGARASFSSIGPTLDGRVKPDISAPGVNIASSVSSFTDEQFQQGAVIQTIPFNGRTYSYVRFSGTSMSGPMVTGIVALMLQANPLLTPIEIKEIIHQTARLDNNTGVIGADTGSTLWGWGKINALNAIKRSLDLVNISTTDYSEGTIYPNPSNSKVYCLFDDKFKPLYVDVFNSEGKKIFTQFIQDQDAIDVSSLKGLYIFRFIGKNSTFSKKIIVQ